MNTPNGTQEGPRSARPNREKISFRIDVPEFLTLEFEPPTEARPGNWGDQYMYFGAENKIAFVEPIVHEKICALHAHIGQTVVITKGRKGEWEVKRTFQAQPDQNSPTSARAERSMPYKTENWQQPGPPAQAPRKALPPLADHFPERHRTPNEDTGNVMAHSLTQAMEACKLAGFEEASREDIRALAITIYITTTGGRK